MDHFDEVDNRQQDSNRKLAVSQPLLQAGVIIALLLFMAEYMREAWLLPGTRNTAGVGPGAFPMLIAAGTFLGLVPLLVISAAHALRGDKDTVVVTRAVWVGLSVLAFAAVALLFEIAGTYIGLAFLSASLQALGGERRLSYLVGLPLGLTFAIYVLFGLVLGVDFP